MGIVRDGEHQYDTPRDFCAGDERLFKIPDSLETRHAVSEGVPFSKAAVDKFTVKDSGERQQFSSGMVRDTANDKVNSALVLDGPMFLRWATHLTKGAIKYTKRNWMKAAGDEEYERFRESAVRHFVQCHKTRI